MTALIITVDTEVRIDDSALNNPDSQIYGRTSSGEYYGITYIMDRVAKRDSFCTFFVNVYDTDLWGAENVSDVAREIHRRGFDVELHTHVEHLDSSGRYSVPIIRRGISECSFEQQQKILAEGITRIQNWTGKRPSWHRAGDLYADLQTLRACEQAGLYGDSSFLYGWPQCMGLGIGPERRNKPQSFGKVLELPVTTFRMLPILRHFRHFDLDACTLNELVSVTEQAIQLKLPYLVLLMHSFSLVKRNAQDIVCHEQNCEKFERYLDFASRAAGLEIMPIGQVQRQGPCETRHEEKGETRDLYTGLILAYERAWRQWHRGAMNKLFALLPVLVCLLLIVLAYTLRHLR